MVLTMFTVDGGPWEPVLDLSEIFAVDEGGMAPVLEAGDGMRLRMASLRLASGSAPVAGFLDDVRYAQALTTGRPPNPDGGPGDAAVDDGHSEPRSGLR
jgi:hypothetical protein